MFSTHASVRTHTDGLDICKALLCHIFSYYELQYVPFDFKLMLPVYSQQYMFVNIRNMMFYVIHKPHYNKELQELTSLRCLSKWD